MIVYFFIFGVFSFLGLLLGHPYFSNTKSVFSLEKNIYLFLCCLLILFAGFRNEVGGDWFAYKAQFEGITDFRSVSLSIFTKPLLSTVGAFVKFFDGDINWFFFILSLFSLGPYLWICSLTPNPFFAVAASFFWVVVILQFGFTAQGVAFSFLIVCFYFIVKNRIMMASCFFLGAVGVHFSSLLFAPILAVKFLRKLWVIVFGVPLLLIGSIWFAQTVGFDYVFNLASAYMQMHVGEGSNFRSVISMISAILFARWAIQFRSSVGEDAYRLFISLIILFVMVIGLGVVLGGVLFDRLQLYFLGGWLLLGGSIHSTVYFGLRGYHTDMVVVLFLSSAIIGAWFLFADHSYLWLPYRSTLFGN